MKLGVIQKDILTYLERCKNGIGVICSITKAEEFRGYDLEQVERSINRLIDRGIIKHEGIYYKLTQRYIFRDKDGRVL